VVIAGRHGKIISEFDQVENILAEMHTVDNDAAHLAWLRVKGCA